MTQEQLDALNAFQHSGRFHPFTCGGNRTDEKHLDGEGILEATPDGWKCPYCDYTQSFGHPVEAFMLEGHRVRTLPDEEKL
jgi:hypothetical protein